MHHNEKMWKVLDKCTILISIYYAEKYRNDYLHIHW